ncbi:MAG: DinB family protein [Chloroflexi bacterium]|nr:DinB family protein [Chloroflexota bacterium]MCC6895123.1 DinB family protein [Anaerolineae bacterium]
MDKPFFIKMFDYNFWTHHKVWDCVLRLTDEQFQRPLDYSVGSIQNQCVHVLATEMMWFNVFMTGIAAVPQLGVSPPRRAIQACWDDVEDQVQVYLRTLDQAELEREVKPHFWEDSRPAIRVCDAMMQVLNHSTDHRAQILAGLHSLGVQTVEQDLLNYLFAKKRQNHSAPMPV